MTAIPTVFGRRNGNGSPGSYANANLSGAMSGGNAMSPLPSDVAAVPPGNSVAPLTPNPIRALEEKVRAATLAGRVNFLPYLDPYTEETPAMRRMYPVMLRHGVVKQSLATKVESVAQLPMQVQPASDGQRDAEVADFVRYAYQDALDGEWQGLVQEILYPALILKSSICELVWYLDLWNRGRWQGKRFLKCLKAKEFATPIQDEYRNIVGIRAIGFGQSEIFSPEDYAVFFNFRLFHGAGMSDLRAAYILLWQLDTVEKIHGIHLENYLTPHKVATYSAGFDLNQLPFLEADLQLMKSRTWAIVPDTVKLESLQMATRGESEYLEYCKDRREQIALSIAGAFLQMLTAGHAGEMRGDAKTQKSTAELLVESLAGKITSVINKQVTPRLIAENYQGADYPKVALGATDLADQEIQMDLMVKAQGMGFPVSMRGVGRDFAIPKAVDDADTLKPPQQQQQGMGGGGPQNYFVDEFTDPETGERRSFCGGPGGKPGPCPTASGEGDRDDANKNGRNGNNNGQDVNKNGHSGNNRVIQHLAEIESDLATDVQPAIEKSSRLRDLSVKVAAAVVRLATPHVLAEFPVWATETCDLWMQEHAMNASGGQGMVMAGKVAAFAALKAWNGAKAGVKRLRGFADDDLDQVAGKLHDLMSGIGQAAGFPVPSLDELRRQLVEAKQGGRGSLDRMEDRRRRSPVARGNGRGVVADPKAKVRMADRDEDERRRRRGGGNPNGLLQGQGFDDGDAGSLALSGASRTNHSLLSKSQPTGQAPVQIALAGHDGARAEQLLANAKSHGARIMAELTRGALRRLLAKGRAGAMRAKRLFSDAQRNRLAAALASTVATADLLGRVRIRKRADQVEQHYADANRDRTKRFSDAETDFVRLFDEGGLRPMPPAQAVEYFTGLVPGLTIDAKRFAPLFEKRGFSLAASTDGVLLGKVKDAIRKRLETGEDIRGGPKAIQAILEDAGVAPENPNYAQSIFRTEMMGAFNAGSQRELSDLTDVFPAFLYSNPADSRSRKAHAARNGRLYPSTTLFEDVRGRDAADVIQCRCVPIAVDKYELAERLAAGEKVEVDW